MFFSLQKRKPEEIGFGRCVLPEEPSRRLTLRQALTTKPLATAVEELTQGLPDQVGFADQIF